MNMQRQINDGALDALAFLESVITSQTYNWQWLLDNADRDQLLVGMTKVAKSLLLAVAAANGVTALDALTVQRDVLLTEGDAA